MNLVWFFIIVLAVLFMFGCSALYHYRSDKQPPKVIITLIDVHGNVTVQEIRDIRSIKVVTSIYIDYVHEYMPILD